MDSGEGFNFWATFNWLDIVLGLGLITTLLIGLGAGFYRQVAMVFAICVGVLLASQLTTPLAGAEFWQPVTEQLGETGSRAAAYGSIVLATLLVGLGVVLTFRSFFSKPLRFFDSILGGATGVAIGGLLFGATLLGVCQWDSAPIHQTVRESFLGGYLADGARYASRLFPPEFRERVENSLSDLPERLAQDAKDLVPATGQEDAGKPEPATHKEKSF